MKKTLIAILVIVMVCSAIYAGGSKEKTESQYVASTSWVASIAELAGLDDVVSIAPANLKHPPEYEITADDLVTVKNSKLFIYAGYEKMMGTISNAAEVNSMKIKTQNKLSVLQDAVTSISEAAGTQKEAEKRFSEYEKLITEAREQVKALGLDKIPCYVNTNQTPLAEDLGLNVAGTFGPAPLTSDQIAQAASNQYSLIIDNVHNPVTDPLKDVCQDSTILIWRNFPDHTGNNALYNVVKDNIDSLLAAFSK